MLSESGSDSGCVKCSVLNINYYCRKWNEYQCTLYLVWSIYYALLLLICLIIILYNEMNIMLALCILYEAYIMYYCH